MTYAWTPDNLLAGVDASGLTLANTYDGVGRRVGRTENGTATTFVLDDQGGLEVVLEESTGSDWAVSTHGLGLVSRETASGITYYLADALGSTRLLIDESGAVVGGYTYDALGAELLRTDATGNSAAFTGQWREPQGLTFVRARFYEADTGRLPGLASRPQSLNPYAYVVNRPLTLTDRTGRSAWDNTVGFVRGVWIGYQTGETINSIGDAVTDQEQYMQSDSSVGRQIIRGIENCYQFADFVPGMSTLGGGDAMKQHPFTENAYSGQNGYLDTVASANNYADIRDWLYGPEMDRLLNDPSGYSRGRANHGRSSTYLRVVPPDVAPYTYGQRYSQVFPK